MTCTSPFLWKPKGSPAPPRWVPCGQCLSCRIKRAAEWRVRLMGELEYSDRAGFVTWTYADLPAHGSLEKRVLQLALKRLRKAVGQRTLRYYACGEYGEKSHRPHYHGIVFGLDWRDRQVVDETWGLGRTGIGTVSSDSILYVCDYATKSVLGKGAVEEYDDTGRERPFSLVSRGMGARWCDAHAEALRENGLSVGGTPIGVPRYYARRLGISSGGREYEIYLRNHLAAMDRRVEVDEVHQERVDRGEYQDRLDSLWASRGQREKTLEQRRVLRRKGKL